MYKLKNVKLPFTGLIITEGSISKETVISGEEEYYILEPTKVLILKHAVSHKTMNMLFIGSRYLISKEYLNKIQIEEFN